MPEGYQLAVASILPINETIHVGDPDTEALVVRNTADPTDSSSENLIASIGGVSADLTVQNAGPTSEIAPGTSNVELTIGFSTAQAGVITGSVTVNLISDGGIGLTSIDNHGQTPLGPQNVPVNITVNNFAVALLQEISGGGTFTHTGNSYTLDLGNIFLGSPGEIIDLGLANAAAGPADLLESLFDLSGDTAFSTSAFDPVDSIGAGASVEIGTVTLDTSHLGLVHETITLHPSGYNENDFQRALPDQTLTITAQVVGESESEGGPVAQSGLTPGLEDTPIHGTLSASDQNNLPLTFMNVTQPQHGSLQVSSDGSFVYTPDGNYNGPDSFNFQASDGFTVSNVATMSLFLDPVNDAPVNTLPAAANFEANVGGPITGLSIADDSGQGIIKTTLSDFYGIINVKAHQGVTITGNGTDKVTLTGTLDNINAALAAKDGVLYASPHDFFGTDTFKFTTDDQGNTGIGGPLSDTDTMAIHVNTYVGETLGNDSAHAGPGNEFLLGSLGTDTVTFDFRLVDAKISYEGHLLVIDGPSSHTVLSGFEVFKFTDGTVNNADGDVLVDDLYYYGQNHDVWNAHVDADTHYHTVGWKEGRDPNAFFNTDFYLAKNHDVAVAGVDPLVQFDQTGWKEGRQPSTKFDPQQYLAEHPNVAAAHIDPLAHFMQYGFDYDLLAPKAGDLWAPNGFDYSYYLLHNPDVAASGIDPFLHYETVGWKEGRNPNPFFDTKGYLAAYADVAASGMNPLDHYHQIGWHEGRDPSVNFDTKSYLAAYPDVVASGADPLEHYLQFGNHENRLTFADGHFG